MRSDAIFTSCLFHLAAAGALLFGSGFPKAVVADEREFIGLEGTEAQTPLGGYSVIEFSRFLQLAPNFQRSKGTLEPELISQQLSTDLGTVLVRYPRESAVLRVLSPVTSVRRSWEAAAATLLELGIPPFPAEQLPEWNVILTDQSRLEVNGSRVSTAFCHTALMGPPADIVIDGYRLLHPCDGASVANPERALQRSLVHEIGHGVEYQLLGNGINRRQRWHAEGFATWFETWATGKLKGEDSKKIQDLMRGKARLAFQRNWKPYLFQGSPADYLTSYALIASIAERRSVASLVAVYQRSSRDHLTLEQAVEREFGLSFAQWMAEAEAFLAAS